MHSPDEQRVIQAIAKEVLAALGPTIRANDTEAAIALRAADLMAQRGITETWYYDCPALVLVGSRSCVSASGRTYMPSN